MNGSFDWRSMQRQGFFITTLTEQTLSTLTEAMKSVEYVPLEPEAHGDNPAEKQYASRTVSKFSVDRTSPPAALCEYAKKANGFCAEFLALFNHNEPTEGMYLFAQRTYEGYHMDPHDDLSDACGLTVLTYLGEGWSPEDGGELVMSKVRRGPDGSVIHRQELAVIPPQPGTVVVFNNKDCFLQHEVRPSMSPNRYMVYLGLGTTEFTSDANLSKPY